MKFIHRSQFVINAEGTASNCGNRPDLSAPTATKTQLSFTRRQTICTSALALGSLLVTGLPALAQKVQFPGVTETEIRIGNTAPYSGPGSAFSTIAKVEAAYFRMINDNGGINGRKINFISYDDALSPPKTVEQTRKLVESDEVLAVFNTIGTAANLAAQKYLNAKQVPQLLVGGAQRISWIQRSTRGQWAGSLLTTARR